MKLKFLVERNGELDTEPIEVDGVGPSWLARVAIRAARAKIVKKTEGSMGYAPDDAIRVEARYNGTSVCGTKTLKENGITADSTLTLHWDWSEYQRKKVDCSTNQARLKAYEDQKSELSMKREAFLKERGITENDLAAIGFIRCVGDPCELRKRERSRSRKHRETIDDTYHVYRSLSGRRLRAHSYLKEQTEEMRMLDIGDSTASCLNVHPDQIRMEKSLCEQSGECRILITVMQNHEDETCHEASPT